MPGLSGKVALITGASRGIGRAPSPCGSRPIGHALVMDGGYVIHCVQFILSPVLAASPLIKSGKVQALGVTTSYRAQSLPDVPTIAEAGLPKFEYQGWYGMLAPSRTPRQIVDLLAKEIGAILDQAEVKERIAGQGAVAKSSTPEAFDKLVHEEIATRRKVWKAAGVKAE